MSVSVSTSLFGELRLLVRIYRGEAVFPEVSRGEAAVVLGAQVLPGGRPSGALEARVRHAARLYAEGRVARIIPTGGLGEHPPSEAEVAARILRGAGVPEQDILLEGKAKNTRESARLVAALVKEREIQDLVIVTDPLHCVRTAGAFVAEGLPVRVSPVYSSPMWRKTWPRRMQLAREIGAILWYRARRAAKPRAG